MPFMIRIPSDLSRFGLKVETVPGWETRGSSAFAPAAVTCHWTAGPRNATGRPSLNVVVNGRPDLDGPLCNIYLARDGTCVVVAAGRANHAGAGGFRGLVGNSAVYGIEAESAGDGDWTDAQRAAYPRLTAALMSGLGRDASWVHGHNEWAPTRKIDIRDIAASVRSQAAAVLANPQQEDVDMTPDQSRKLDAVYAAIFDGGTSMPGGLPLKDLVNGIPARVWATTVNREGQQISALQELADAKTQAIASAAQAAGFQSALAAVQAGQPVDLAAVTAAARAGAEDALKGGVKVTVDVPGGAA